MVIMIMIEVRQSLCVTVSGKGGLIAYLKVSRKPVSNCYSSPMIVATCTNFSHVYNSVLPSRSSTDQAINNQVSCLLNSVFKLRLTVSGELNNRLVVGAMGG